MRDPCRVLHDLCEAAEGGIKEQARRIGRSPGVLYNKLADSMPQYEVSLREAMALVRGFAGAAQLEWVGSVCGQFGGLFVPLPDGPAGEADLMDSLLAVTAQFGEMARQYEAARRDGLITSDEAAAVRVECLRMMRVVHAFALEVESSVALPGVR